MDNQAVENTAADGRMKGELQIIAHSYSTCITQIILLAMEESAQVS
jgi:hypothetical protein